jgi:hypothetical protein
MLLENIGTVATQQHVWLLKNKHRIAAGLKSRAYSFFSSDGHHVTAPDFIGALYVIGRKNAMLLLQLFDAYSKIAHFVF